MADVPKTPTFIAHGWAAFMLLAGLGLWLILWCSILLTILILTILNCTPLGRLTLWGPSLAIAVSLTTPNFQIPALVLAWAFFAPANLHLAFQALHSKIHALTSLMKALICGSVYVTGLVLTSKLEGESPWSPVEATLVVTCCCPYSKAYSSLRSQAAFMRAVTS